MEFKEATQNLELIILDGNITVRGQNLTGREHLGLQASYRTLVELAQEALAAREEKKEIKEEKKD